MKKLKIALLGYGRMGKEIEQQAVARGHEIVVKLDHTNTETFDNEELKKADVAIEFSTPHSAYDNIMRSFGAGVPVVCGTTGWLGKLEEVKEHCTARNLAFFYASNYSIGVNLFFELNQTLARMMNRHEGYEISIEEIHHTQKLDSPSGTAITIAEGILEESTRKKGWFNTLRSEDSTESPAHPADQLEIASLRIENVPGTHTVRYQSDVDSIEITHTAFSRKGFAAGAVMAAEWTAEKKGIFGMKDLMSSFSNH
jgi:4-hydroxy-tetrahydrodipicolinate reductase